MKKYSKLITLILALIMVVSLFSGFTYKTANVVDVQPLAQVSCSSCSGRGSISTGTACLTSGIRCSNCQRGMTCSNITVSTCTTCGGTGFVNQTATPSPTSTPTPNPITATHNFSGGTWNSSGRIYDIYLNDVAIVTLTASHSTHKSLTYTWYIIDTSGSVFKQTNTTNVFIIPTDTNWDGGIKYEISDGSAVYESDSFGLSVHSKPTPTPTPKEMQDVEFYLVNNINKSETKLYFKVNVEKGMPLGEFKTKYINTNNLVRGFCSFDMFGYHVMADYHLITDAGAKVYIVVDNPSLILDVDTPTIDKPITVAKIQSIKVDYVVDNKIFYTINKLPSDVANTFYNVEPPTNLFKTFKGWGVAKDAKDVIESSWKPTGNTTLYAIYEQSSGNVSDKPTNTVSIVLIVILVFVVLWVLSRVFFRNGRR